MSDENQSPLERMQNRLYKPDATSPFLEPKLRQQEVPRAFTWTPASPPPPKKKLPVSALVLICGVAFFVLSLGASTLFLVFGARSVSTDHVLLVPSASSPTIASGDAVSLTITVTNKNPTPLTDTSLSVDYPEGTLSADGTEQPFPRYVDTLGSIDPGQTVTRTATAIISGSANQVVTLPVTLQYQTKGSNATFVKKAEYTLTITSSPVSVSVDALSQSASGQPITLSVHVHSNATAPLPNVALLAAYPPGFSKQRINPTASASTDTGDMFLLGALQPGDERTLTVTGTLTGSEGDVRAFHFTAGTPKDAQNLALSYATQESDVTLTKPFLAVSLALNSASADTVVVSASTPVQGLLSWVNTLPTPITNAQISVHLSGNALDPRTVSTDTGFYRSADTTLLWNGDTTPGLRQLGSGDTGSGTFSFTTKANSQLASIQNPSIQVAISVAGQRVGESGVPQTVTSTLTRTVKIATNLSISSRAVHSVGPFKNTGPWPPTPNQETTYTILLNAGSTVNAVAGVKVTAALPSYVRFTGTVSPADGSITYNDANRTVTWDIGSLPQNGTKQGAFQVALLPSDSQRGTSPVLMFGQTITGKDQFTLEQVTGSGNPVTIQTDSDPGYTLTFGTVTQ